MNKYILFFWFVWPLTTIAQKDSISQSFIKKKFSTEYIVLAEKKSRHNDLSPFGKIQVIDMRRDTSRIGISGVRSGRKQLMFNTPASNSISAWLNKNYTDRKNNRSLLVIIKDLWLFDTDEMLTEGQRVLPNNSDMLRIGNLEFRCEAYLFAGNEYVPITYLDTTVISTFHGASALATYRMPEVLEAFMNKVASFPEISILRPNWLFYG